MEYTSLGSTGTNISKLCFGTWRFGQKSGTVVETDREDEHELLDTAADHGINFTDTANWYSQPSGTSEQYIGYWLAERDRDDFVIATKVGLFMDDEVNKGSLSPRHI